MREGWEYKKLGEVCEIYQPKTLSTDMLTKTGGYPVYGANGIIGYYNQYNHEEQEVLLTCRGATCGTVNISKPYSWINGNAMVIHRKSEEMDFNFLKYLMLSLDYSLIITGAAQPQITRQKLAPTKIKIPPKSTQLAIVSELDKINELIRLKKEQLKDYDNLAQSIFYEMFGDPVDNEKGWEVKKWKEVFNTILGKMLDKSKQINHLKQYKYLANMNVQWGYFDLKELRSMTFTDEELAKYELRNNDLLICEGGDAGRCAIWKETDETILFQKAIHRARLIDTDNADVVYIRYWMQFYKVNKGLKDYISKSTIEHLTGDKLKRLPIPLPPLPLQHLFAQRIEQIERQKSAVQKSITDLETILASRMQYWFE